MTYAAMQWHEQVTLRYGVTDYRRTSLVQLVRPHVRGRRVLDLRCLRGEFVVDLAARGVDVLGLDGYGQAVEVTNSAARIRGIASPIAQQWDLTGLAQRVGPRQFDSIIAADILNHMPDDEAAVRDIAAVLAPGGRVLLVVPAFPSLLGARDRSLGHLRRYTKASLRSLLEHHGLRIRSMRYWNFTALPVYVLVERLLKRRLSDGLRYGQGGFFGSLSNRALRWWYATVENHVAWPAGLSLFAIAETSVVQEEQGAV